MYSCTAFIQGILAFSDIQTFVRSWNTDGIGFTPFHQVESDYSDSHCIDAGEPHQRLWTCQPEAKGMTGHGTTGWFEASKNVARGISRHEDPVNHWNWNIWKAQCSISLQHFWWPVMPWFRMIHSDSQSLSCLTGGCLETANSCEAVKAMLLDPWTAEGLTNFFQDFRNFRLIFRDDS